MKEALSAVWQRKRLIAEQLAGYAVLGYLGWLWLGLPVARAWQVAVLVIAALAWIAALFFLARRAVTRLRRDTPRLPAPQLVVFSVAAIAAAAVGAYLLAAWVPEFQGLPAQAVSFAVRFFLAYLLVVFCGLTVVALIASGKPVSTH